VKLGGNGTITEPIYTSENVVTIRFKTDGSVVRTGFALSIDMVSKPSCTAAKAVDVQGNYYFTVQIGDQCWMRENLRTTKYANGANIPDGGSNMSETEPYYYNYSSSGRRLEQRVRRHWLLRQLLVFYSRKQFHRVGTRTALRQSARGQVWRRQDLRIFRPLPPRLKRTLSKIGRPTIGGQPVLTFFQCTMYNVQC
jgi:hypothetical protein